MGLIRRKKSGNIFGGSKLNVPGQGIYNVKISESDKIPVNGINPTPKRRPTPTPTKPPLPTPTPTPSITSTQTPTPTVTSTVTITPSITSSPTPTQTPTITSTNTPTPTITQTPTITPTPTQSLPIVCLLAQENYDNILTENGDFIIVECP